MPDLVTTSATRAIGLRSALLDALVLPAGHAVQSLHLGPRLYTVLTTAPDGTPTAFRGRLSRRKTYTNIEPVPDEIGTEARLAAHHLRALTQTQVQALAGWPPAPGTGPLTTLVAALLRFEGRHLSLLRTATARHLGNLPGGRAALVTHLARQELQGRVQVDTHGTLWWMPTQRRARRLNRHTRDGDLQTSDWNKDDLPNLFGAFTTNSFLDDHHPLVLTAPEVTP